MRILQVVSAGELDATERKAVDGGVGGGGEGEEEENFLKL